MALVKNLLTVINLTRFDSFRMCIFMLEEGVQSKKVLVVALSSETVWGEKYLNIESNFHDAVWIGSSSNEGGIYPILFIFCLWV